MQEIEGQNCCGVFSACNKKTKQPNFDDVHCPHRLEYTNMMDRLLTPATFGDRWLRSGPSRMSLKLTLTTCCLVNKCSLIDEGKPQEILLNTLSKSEKPLHFQLPIHQFKAAK